MSSYNLIHRDHRNEERAARAAEVAAIDAGTWPRDLNDEFRWGATKTFHDRAEQAAYARRMCVNEIEYLDGVPARIAADELPGWEA